MLAGQILKWQRSVITGYLTRPSLLNPQRIILLAESITRPCIVRHNQFLTIHLFVARFPQLLGHDNFQRLRINPNEVEIEKRASKGSRCVGGRSSLSRPPRARKPSG